MSNNYNKPALTIDQQIDLLESRNLNIPDKEKARHYLQFISYYRLSGYTISFENVIDGRRNHQFKNGTTFENVLALYDFDRHLRMLVMDAIERIEVAVRTQICLHMAVTYNDGHWHLRRNLFKHEFNYNALIKKCTEEQQNSKERFVLHYKNTYDQPELVPSWMTTELLPMGTWSMVYKNLVNRSDKKKMSDVFKLSPVDLESWLHALTYIRNLCAHHSRIWNRHFTIRPKQISEYVKYLTPNTTFAAQAAMMHLLLKIISPDSRWTNRLFELLTTHPFVNPARMGFTSNWQQDIFWGINNA
jgi:abortive infection bacteriophage resistance protein